MIVNKTILYREIYSKNKMKLIIKHNFANNDISYHQAILCKKQAN